MVIIFRSKSKIKDEKWWTELEKKLDGELKDEVESHAGMITIVDVDEDRDNK